MRTGLRRSSSSFRALHLRASSELSSSFSARLNDECFVIPSTTSSDPAVPTWTSALHEHDQQQWQAEQRDQGVGGPYPIHERDPPGQQGPESSHGRYGCRGPGAPRRHVVRYLFLWLSLTAFASGLFPAPALTTNLIQQYVCADELYHQRGGYHGASFEYPTSFCTTSPVISRTAYLNAILQAATAVPLMVMAGAINIAADKSRFQTFGLFLPALGMLATFLGMVLLLFFLPPFPLFSGQLEGQQITMNASAWPNIGAVGIGGTSDLPPPQTLWFGALVALCVLQSCTGGYAAFLASAFASAADIFHSSTEKENTGAHKERIREGHEDSSSKGEMYGKRGVQVASTFIFLESALFAGKGIGNLLTGYFVDKGGGTSLLGATMCECVVSVVSLLCIVGVEPATKTNDLSLASEDLAKSKELENDCGRKQNDASGDDRESEGPLYRRLAAETSSSFLGRFRQSLRAVDVLRANTITSFRHVGGNTGVPRSGMAISLLIAGFAFVFSGYMAFATPFVLFTSSVYEWSVATQSYFQAFNGLIAIVGLLGLVAMIGLKRRRKGRRKHGDCGGTGSGKGNMHDDVSAKGGNQITTHEAIIASRALLQELYPTSQSSRPAMGRGDRFDLTTRLWQHQPKEEEVEADTWIQEVRATRGDDFQANTRFDRRLLTEFAKEAWRRDTELRRDIRLAVVLVLLYPLGSALVVWGGGFARREDLYVLGQCVPVIGGAVFPIIRSVVSRTSGPHTQATSQTAIATIEAVSSSAIPMIVNLILSSWHATARSPHTSPKPFLGLSFPQISPSLSSSDIRTLVIPYETALVFSLLSLSLCVIVVLFWLRPLRRRCLKVLAEQMVSQRSARRDSPLRQTGQGREYPLVSATLEEVTIGDSIDFIGAVNQRPLAYVLLRGAGEEADHIE